MQIMLFLLIVNVGFSNVSVRSNKSGVKCCNSALVVADSLHCPDEGPHARATVEQLINDPALAEASTSADIGSITTNDIQLLVDSTDAEACDSLRAIYPVSADSAFVDTYFKTVIPGKTRYFVTRTLPPLPMPTPTDPNTIMVIYGRVGIGVYDENFNNLGMFTW